MTLGIVLRIIMVLVGIILLLIAINSLAQNKMTAPFCLTWAVVAIIIIVAGIVLNPSEWNSYISSRGLVLLLLMSFGLIYGTYFVSMKVSELMRSGTEMAIQISLLKTENNELKKRLEQLEKKVNGEENA